VTQSSSAQERGLSLRRTPVQAFPDCGNSIQSLKMVVRIIGQARQSWEASAQGNPVRDLVTGKKAPDRHAVGAFVLDLWRRRAPCKRRIILGISAGMRNLSLPGRSPRLAAESQLPAGCCRFRFQPLASIAPMLQYSCAAGDSKFEAKGTRIRGGILPASRLICSIGIALRAFSKMV